MGMYVSVRGWLEVDRQQGQQVEKVIDRHRHDLYSGGWAFPAAPFNWTLYVFYGGDLRESELGWFRDQLSELATLPPVDDDLDLPAGLFLLSDERQTSTLWTVRNGQVDETPAPPDLHWFALRP
jgi:hypothetical protein